MKYDVAVIGGGSAGYVAGSVLARNGKKVAVIERKAFGGVCVNSGCVPSIFLSDISFLFSRLQEIGDYTGLEINVSKADFFSKRKNMIQTLSEAGKKLIEDAGGDAILGEAKILSCNELEINEEGKRSVIEYEKLIIASGSFSSPPNIPGIENAISEDEAVNLSKIPDSMVIIGGGYAGTEIAQIFSRLGSNVSLITRSKIMKDIISDEARKILMDSLDWDNVNVIENVEVECIKDGKVITNKGIFDGETVVYATGRKPNIPEGIEKIDVKFNQNGIVVNDGMKTSNDRIYAIGDVIDKEKKVAHAAMFEGIVSALNILGKNEKVSYDCVPQVLYTDPEIGIVGRKDRAVEFSSFPFSAVTRATIKGLREGYVKIGINEEEKIVYGEIVSPLAEELINILAIAIKNKMSAKDLAYLPAVHPSLSEAIVNSARSFYNLDVDRFRGMKDES
ncbi:dihydrolipoyl dehydrogenase family protein [Acidianus manzaensis]|uniref:Pyridine nucleotide-disulfide oxidoreductase n=1 Tax=Acidianus manzaensis TaxID=282676 RepID=A0A1W6K2J5_9CREN|nr:NAD(P)/FAD-dependent oxidoreductase [Acidianus manzaensis]ARM76763.1 pyridine nucleotide-disulfide oxidoreductase [Acidianus manzaensis]